MNLQVKVTHSTPHNEVAAALIPPTDLPAFNNALHKGWPKTRKSGFPYFTVCSPVVANPPSRKVGRRAPTSSDIDVLLSE